MAVLTEQWFDYFEDHRLGYRPLCGSAAVQDLVSEIGVVDLGCSWQSDIGRHRFEDEVKLTAELIDLLGGEDSLNHREARGLERV